MSGDVRDPSAWMRFADEDLQAARILSGQEDAFALAHIIAFHAHQSASRGCWRSTREQNPPHIHNLRKLLTEAFRYAPELETPELEDASNGLDQPAATLPKSAAPPAPYKPQRPPTLSLGPKW